MPVYWVTLLFVGGEMLLSAIVCKEGDRRSFFLMKSNGYWKAMGYLYGHRRYEDDWVLTELLLRAFLMLTVFRKAVLKGVQPRTVFVNKQVLIMLLSMQEGMHKL